MKKRKGKRDTMQNAGPEEAHSLLGRRWRGRAGYGHSFFEDDIAARNRGVVHGILKKKGEKVQMQLGKMAIPKI